MLARRLFLMITLLASLGLACNLAVNLTEPPPQNLPVVDATKMMLELQATQMSLQLTQAAMQAISTPAPPATTNPENPTSLPAEAVPTSQPDVADQMKSAKILVYEDTPRIGYWIRDTLDGMGLKYTHVGDAIGNFMENLNSGIDWDLIIVGAESKSKVQGEFWDVIEEKVTQNQSALIAEVWYLDRVGNGRIKNIMTQCGIEFQRDWALAESIYWLDSNNIVFNEPNTVLPLLNYNRHWDNQAGDLIRLSSGSNATLLAGTFEKEKARYGVLASCFDGRVIFQTFSNHDYHRDQIILLWQNYITNTLKNHFSVAH